MTETKRKQLFIELYRWPLTRYFSVLVSFAVCVPWRYVCSLQKNYLLTCSRTFVKLAPNSRALSAVKWQFSVLERTLFLGGHSFLFVFCCLRYQNEVNFFLGFPRFGVMTPLLQISEKKSSLKWSQINIKLG